MEHYLFEPVLQAQDKEALDAAILRVVQQLGFDIFCYGILTQPSANIASAYFSLDNYPVWWPEYYVSQGWLERDPVVLHSLTNTTPLIWRESLFNEPELKHLHREACAVGINGGASFPIHSPWLNGVGCLLMATGEDMERSIPHVIETLAAGQLLACYVNQAVRNLQLLQPEHSFVQDKELTRREKECLRWAINGLSAKAIARKMNVSVSTITSYYLPAIRSKLGVSSTREAVSLAVYYRLVEF